MNENEETARKIHCVETTDHAKRHGALGEIGEAVGCSQEEAVMQAFHWPFECGHLEWVSTLSPLDVVKQHVVQLSLFQAY